MIKPYANNIEKIVKGELQLIRLGVDLEGNLFYPESHVTNEANDELYEWFHIRGPVPDSIYRISLDCINDLEGLYIPPKAFEEEILYQWGRRSYTRDKMVEILEGLLPEEVERGQLIEMARGRVPYKERDQGMVISIAKSHQTPQEVLTVLAEEYDWRR